jgi:ABC-type glutathione transport system ATPase component
MIKALKIEGLSVRYGDSPGYAVKDVSFDLSQGEAVAILGESGSGKSTLLGAICGLLPWNARASGRFEFLGETKRKPALGKDIAIVFQDPFSAFDPFLTMEYQALEAFYAWGNGTRDEALLQVMSVFERVGLGIGRSELRKYPFQFSGGMLQRACLGLAILHNPSLLLLDEPTSALDTLRKLEFARLLSSFVEASKMALLVATHDLPFALAVCSRVLVMEEGSIVFQGNAKELVSANNAKEFNIVKAFWEQRRFLGS